MSWVATAVTVSTAIGVGSALDSADKAKKLAKKQKAAAREQAIEMERKSEYNIKLAEEEAQSLKGFQTAQFAKAGVDVGSGAPLMVLAQTDYNLKRDSLEQRAEVFRAGELLKKGAAVDARAIMNQARAGVTSSFAAAAGNFASYKMASGNKNTKGED